MPTVGLGLLIVAGILGLAIAYVSLGVGFTPRLTDEMMHRMNKEDEADLLRCQKKVMYAENGKAWGKELFENAKAVVRVGMVDSPTVQQLLWNEYKYTCTERWGEDWSIQKLRALS